VADDPVTLDRCDQHALLGRVAGRLQLKGFACLGLAADLGGRGSLEHRVLTQLADDLHQAAALLDALRERLCRPCQLASVSTRLHGERPE